MPAYWRPGPACVPPGRRAGDSGLAPFRSAIQRPSVVPRYHGVTLPVEGTTAHALRVRYKPPELQAEHSNQTASISIKLFSPTHSSASCPNHIYTVIGLSHAPLLADTTRQQPSCPRLYAAWLYAVNMQPRALSNRHHAADATIGSHGSALQSITTKECLCGAR